MDELHTIHVEYDEQLTREHIEWWAACDSDAYSDRIRPRIFACRKWLDEHPEQPEWFTDPRDGTIIDQAGCQYHFLDGAWRSGWGNPVDIDPSGWTLLFRPPDPGNEEQRMSAAEEARRLLDNDIAWDDDVISRIIGGLLAERDALAAENKILRDVVARAHRAADTFGACIEGGAQRALRAAAFWYPADPDNRSEA